MRPTTPLPPSILLVEDDPTSLAFLRAALESMPARVATATRIDAALALARAGGHALWLVDAHLPDGAAADFLRVLRSEGHATPALAHTAGTDPVLHAGLRAAGFADVLVKPFPAQALVARVAQLLPGPLRIAEATPPVWDEAAGLRAVGGDPAHARALRALFVQELARQRELVVAALDGGAIDVATAELHRLRAGCGFVGAASLGRAVAALGAETGDAQARAAFEREADLVLASAAATDPA